MWYAHILYYLHSYTIQIPVVTRQRLKITWIILLISSHWFCQYFINDFSQFWPFVHYSVTFIKQYLVWWMQSVICRSVMIKKTNQKSRFIQVWCQILLQQQDVFWTIQTMVYFNQLSWPVPFYITLIDQTLSLTKLHSFYCVTSFI